MRKRIISFKRVPVWITGICIILCSALKVFVPYMQGYFSNSTDLHLIQMGLLWAAIGFSVIEGLRKFIEMSTTGVTVTPKEDKDENSDG